MYTSEDVMEAARSIQPLLTELVGSLDAPDIEGRLANLLLDAEAGGRVDNKILELLTENDVTREWMREYLIADNKDDFVRSYSPLLGNPRIWPSQEYVCPEQGCPEPPWFRRSVGQPVPKCPIHGVELVKV